MTDISKKSCGEARVNLRGVPEHPGTSATISLLPEDTTYCFACGEEIPGLAVYLTRERPERRSGFELVGILHPDCNGAGAKGEPGEDT